jgi:hypothetical protein
MMIFKYEVIDEITCLKALLHRKQNEIQESGKQSSLTVECLTDWTHDMLHT